MSTTRLHWTDLSVATRMAVGRNTGRIYQAETVDGGHNSSIAVRLETDNGSVFVKGLRSDHQTVWTQQLEAEIGTYTGQLAPAFLWRLQTDGWDLVAFRFVEGRHADYSAGSADLALLADTLAKLVDLPTPRMELKRAEDRWADYVHDPVMLAALAGDHLCHTDFNPENVLITHHRAVLTDWAWATHGAPWLDPALAAIWLIATGRQTPTEAEAWAAHLPSWQAAPLDAVTAFAMANARLWREIAEGNPSPWTTSLRDAAQQWANFLNRS